MVKVFNRPDKLEENDAGFEYTPKQKGDAKQLKAKLDELLNSRQGRIIAYIGRFGSGKSVTLKYVEEKYRVSKKKNSPEWMTFEAWRYTDRSKLWNGFVLEVSNTTGGSRQKSKTENQINGISNAKRWVHKHPTLTTLLTLPIFIATCWFIWSFFLYDESVFALFAKALLKYALPIYFAILILVGVNALFRKHTPLARIEEYEKILEKSLNKPLVVVVEDIDRAGEEGIIFLETLRSFIDKQKDNKKFSYPFIVIAPQDITYMSVTNQDKINGLDRGIKIYDNAMYYGSSVIQTGTTKKLLEVAGTQKEYLDDMVLVAGNILQNYKNQLSPRKIKFILREVHDYAATQDNVNPGIALLFISMRYIKHLDEKSYLEHFHRARLSNFHLTSGTQPVSKFIQILIKAAGIKETASQCHIEFTKDVDEIKAEITRKNVNDTVVLEMRIHDRYRQLLS